MHDGGSLFFPFVSRSLLPGPLKALLLMLPWANATWLLQHFLSLLQWAAQSNSEQAGLQSCWCVRSTRAMVGQAEVPGSCVQLGDVSNLVPAAERPQVSLKFTSLVFSFLHCKMKGVDMKISKPLPSPIILGGTWQHRQADICPLITFTFQEGKWVSVPWAPYSEHGVLLIKNLPRVRHCSNCFIDT